MTASTNNTEGDKPKQYKAMHGCLIDMQPRELQITEENNKKKLE